MTETTSDEPPRLKFSLRALFTLMTLVAVLAALIRAFPALVEIFLVVAVWAMFWMLLALALVFAMETTAKLLLTVILFATKRQPLAPETLDSRPAAQPPNPRS